MTAQAADTRITSNPATTAANGSSIATTRQSRSRAGEF